MPEALPDDLRGNNVRWGEELTRIFVSHIIETNNDGGEMQLFKTIGENMKTEKNCFVLHKRYRTFLSPLVSTIKATEINDVDRLKLASKYRVKVSEAFARKIGQDYHLLVDNNNPVTDEDVERLQALHIHKNGPTLKNNITQTECLYNFVVDFSSYMGKETNGDSDCKDDEYASKFDETLGILDNFRNQTITRKNANKILDSIFEIFKNFNIQRE